MTLISGTMQDGTERRSDSFLEQRSKSCVLADHSQLEDEGLFDENQSIR